MATITGPVWRTMQTTRGTPMEIAMAMSITTMTLRTIRTPCAAPVSIYSFSV